MESIIIDEEFKLLLPTLDKQTYDSLERSLLIYGAREPLVLWNGILIDGYNRYKICTEHNLPFITTNMEFNSRDEVMTWIIENQISRRNLTSTSAYTGVVSTWPYLDIRSIPDRSEDNYVEKIVYLISDNVKATLKSLKNENDISELKKSLKTLIDSLKELYNNIVAG